MTAIKTMFEIIPELMKLQDAVVDYGFYKENLTSREYLKHFRTIQLNPGRRMGKSYWINSQGGNGDDLLFIPLHSLKHQYPKWRPNFSNKISVADSTGIYSLPMDRFRGIRPKIIYFDEPGMRYNNGIVEYTLEALDNIGTLREVDRVIILGEYKG